jgi:hypothetical protein
MITFSSKIVNYCAIALFFYLLYVSFVPSTDSWQKIYNTLESQTIEAINSGRPINELSWIERVLIWHFKDKAAKKKDEIKPAKPIHEEKMNGNNS